MNINSLELYILRLLKWPHITLKEGTSTSSIVAKASDFTGLGEEFEKLQSVEESLTKLEASSLISLDASTDSWQLTEEGKQVSKSYGMRTCQPGGSL